MSGIEDEAVRVATEALGYRAAGGQARDVVAALARVGLLRAESNPEPHVWLAGDTVPAGVRVLTGQGDVVWCLDPLPVPSSRALVEVHVPDHAAAVAREQERRAGVIQ